MTQFFIEKSDEKVLKTTICDGLVHIYGAKDSKNSGCEVREKREDFSGVILYNIGVKQKAVAKIREKEENENEKQNHLDRIIFGNFGKRLDKSGNGAVSKPLGMQCVFPGLSGIQTEKKWFPRTEENRTEKNKTEKNRT